MKSVVQYRHGDLLIESVAKIPEGAIKRKTSIIFEGEATGHHHRLNGGAVLDIDGHAYLSVLKTATVTHEEHNTITLPAGDYLVIRQREYDPFEDAIRNVKD